MKSKAKFIFSLLIFSNVLLMNLLLFTPQVLAQGATNAPGNVRPATNTPTNTPPTTGQTGSGTFNPPSVAYSGVEGSIKRFLCVPNSSGSSEGDLETCVNRLYRFAAAIGAFAAVFFIALAGYYYILGGEHAKEKAKHMVISVIAGLVIIFTAYILLKQINPDAVKFKTITPPALSGVPELPDCATIFGAEQQCTIGGGQVVVSNGSGGSIGYADCSGGQTSVTGVRSNAGLKICKDLLTKLQQMKAKTDTTGVSWTVAHTTDNPAGHDSSCHKLNTSTSGQCADVVVSAGKWAEACSAAKSAGISILNEASATKGTSAETICGKYVKSPKASANPSNDHLHVYVAR